MILILRHSVKRALETPKTLSQKLMLSRSSSVTRRYQRRHRRRQELWVSTHRFSYLTWKYRAFYGHYQGMLGTLMLSLSVW